MSQCISRVMWSSCFRFVATCFFQVRCLSKCSPRYFTVSAWGRPSGWCTLGGIVLAAEWKLCAWTWSHLSSVSTSESIFQDCVGELEDWQRLGWDLDELRRWPCRPRRCWGLSCWSGGYLLCILYTKADPGCFFGGLPRALGLWAKFRCCMLPRGNGFVSMIVGVWSTLGAGFVWFLARGSDARLSA